VGDGTGEKEGDPYSEVTLTIASISELSVCGGFIHSVRSAGLVWNLLEPNNEGDERVFLN
jgi:hypothetical protein